MPINKTGEQMCLCCGKKLTKKDEGTICQRCEIESSQV